MAVIMIQVWQEFSGKDICPVLKVGYLVSKLYLC